MRRLLLIAGCCILALPAQAARDSLKAAEKELKQSAQKQRQLADRQADLEGDLKALQTQLVRAAASIQANERALADAALKLDKTRLQLVEKEKQIVKNKSRLEALIDVALHFSRMPAEAMVMMPEGSGQTLRVSKALAMLSNDIKEETQKLAQQKQELEALQHRLEMQKAARQQQQVALTEKRKALEAKLKDRRSLQASLHQDQQAEAEKAARLAGKAKDLQDLLKDLTTERKLEADHSQVPASAHRGKLRSFAAAKGKIRLPVTGTLKEGYGQDTRAGSASRGITIATAAGAQVIAPYDGEVIFAGTFLNYGRMAILRHGDDFHTLLAGLSALDIQSGEFLLEGEPIGAMGDKTAHRKLYVELRKGNQPINPGPWIKGLK